MHVEPASQLRERPRVALADDAQERQLLTRQPELRSDVRPQRLGGPLQSIPRSDGVDGFGLGFVHEFIMCHIIFPMHAR